MRLITTKQALVDCLGIVSKAVSSRTSIQVLSGILIDAADEGITMSATDMEHWRLHLSAIWESMDALFQPKNLRTY